MIDTERLTLRPLKMADLADFCDLIRDKLAGPCAAFDEPFPEDDAGLRELLSMFCERGWFLVACSRTDGRTIGLFSLNETGEPGERNIGFLVHSAYQRQGYAREAARAIIACAGEKMCLQRLVALTAAENAPCCALLDSLGFRIAGEQEDVSFCRDENGREIRYTTRTYILDIE